MSEIVITRRTEHLCTPGCACRSWRCTDCGTADLVDRRARCESEPGGPLTYAPELCVLCGGPLCDSCADGNGHECPPRGIGPQGDPPIGQAPSDLHLFGEASEFILVRPSPEMRAVILAAAGLADETFCSTCGPLDEPGVHIQPDCLRYRRDEILPGPRLVCGCPVDSGCDGRHPGALGSASGYDER